MLETPRRWMDAIHRDAASRWMHRDGRRSLDSKNDGMNDTLLNQQGGAASAPLPPANPQQQQHSPHPSSSAAASASAEVSQNLMMNVVNSNSNGFSNDTAVRPRLRFGRFHQRGRRSTNGDAQNHSSNNNNSAATGSAGVTSSLTSVDTQQQQHSTSVVSSKKSGKKKTRSSCTTIKNKNKKLLKKKTKTLSSKPVKKPTTLFSSTKTQNLKTPKNTMLFSNHFNVFNKNKYFNFLNFNALTPIKKMPNDEGRCRTVD